ncbi:hypothetical protein C8R45DRAFT_835122, partial [Mycena sanguinolenta]
IRQFAFAVVNSTTITLPAWRSACTSHNKRVRLIPCDVRTRWNSLYDMLVVAIEYREVVNSLTSDRTLNMRNYEISDSEWDILDDTVFKDATILFSADSKSTIAHVLTTMDKIDDLITSTIVPARRQRVLHSSIRDALKLAKKTMNRYYSANDESNVYRIATSTFKSTCFFKLSCRASPPSKSEAGILQITKMGAKLD